VSDPDLPDGYDEAVDRPLWRLFREYARPHLPWFVAGVGCNILSRASSLVPPLVLGVTIDAVFRTEVSYSLPLLPGAWVPAGRVPQFRFSLALIALSLVATGVFTWAQGVAGDVFAHRVLHEVRVDSYEKLQRLDRRFFDEAETGELLSILNNDASNLEVFLDNAMKNAVRLVVLVALIAGTMVWLNPYLAAVTLVVVPAMVAFTWWFMRAIEPRYAAVRESIGSLNTRLENGLGGIDLVKASATEPYETGRVREASRTFYEANVAVFRLYFLYRPGMEAMAGASFLATFLVGGFWLLGSPPPGLSGGLELGTFVTFLFLTQRFVDPLAQISNVVDWYENAAASGKRVFGLMDVPVGVTDAPDAVELGDPAGSRSRT
jgi:ATP-binding cassette subfamily B protein